MNRSRRYLTLGLLILAALALGGFALRSCDAVRWPTTVMNQTAATGRAPPSDQIAVIPPAAPEPTPAQSARKGQIYFHRNLELLKVFPGEGLTTRFPDMTGQGLDGYQVQSDRLSPDATRLAFGRAVMHPINGGFGTFPPEAIFVREITSTDPAKRIALLEGAEIHNFFWSPDGQSLALSSWDEERGIRNWVVDAASGKSLEIKLPRYTVDGREHSMSAAAWSPDGNWFVVADDILLYLVQIDKTGPAWRWAGRKRLTKEPQAILGGTCSFSPDGRRVLFVALGEGLPMALHTVEVEGNEERTLVSPEKFTDLYACWSPDGNRIAFSGARLESTGKRAGQSGIYVMAADVAGESPAPVLEEVHPPEQFRLRLVDWR